MMTDRETNPPEADQERWELYKDREWLLDQYWNKKKSANQIGLECGCSEYKIYNSLKKFNIDIKNCSESALHRYGKNNSIILHRDKDWLEYQYIMLEKSSKEIGDICNVGKTSIIRWLHKFNIPIRNNSINQYKNIIPFYQNKDWLYTEHIINKKTTEEIALECKATIHTIKKWMLKFKINCIDRKIRSTIIRLYKDKNWLYNQYYDKRKTFEEIALKCNCSAWTISKEFRKFKSLELKELQDQGYDKYLL